MKTRSAGVRVWLLVSFLWSGTPFSFNPRNADDIFAEFLGFRGAGGGGDGSGMRGVSSFDGGGGSGGSPFGSSGGGFSSGPWKDAPVKRTLPCTLEELYKGTTKKMKTVEEILNINIKPGWKKGMKITFPEKGNGQPNTTPVDLVFIYGLYFMKSNQTILEIRFTGFVIVYKYQIQLRSLRWNSTHLILLIYRWCPISRRGRVAA
ncbi:hypothetical protein L2E82_15819 [Cichorium intybus]|uniref:Uncharacterized protein n=1 Tax=Cichorium intybus TaxID=13427 RepID=A0ACB9F4A3_CICIN|nr:hypothetical protein L2E82_15819 [Cichorium intybus]